MKTTAQTTVIARSEATKQSRSQHAARSAGDFSVLCHAHALAETEDAAGSFLYLEVAET